MSQSSDDAGDLKNMVKIKFSLTDTDDVKNI